MPRSFVFSDRPVHAAAAAFAANSMLAATLSYAGVFASAVVEYTPGTLTNPTLQQNGNAALGLPVSNDDGNTTPFTPPFRAASITVVGSGGHITLQLSSIVATGDGPELGVFTNTGLVATTSTGSLTAGTTATGGTAVFSSDFAAISVSLDGVAWTTLNGGQAFDLTEPSNAFLDTTITTTSGIRAGGGTLPADPFKPFTTPLSAFAGKSYPAMVNLFDGSFGGAWIDIAPEVIPAFQYVRLDVGTGQRLVLDAVTAVPEPSAAGLLGAAVFPLLRIRRRRNTAAVQAVPSSPNRSSRFMKSLSIVLAVANLGAIAAPSHAALFAVNGQNYDVAAVAGTGSNKALLELDFGTNASPDVHLFGYQWDAGTPNGRTVLSDLQTASTGVTFTDTYYASFNSYLLNTLWYNTAQPADDYPNAFWLWFTGADGQSWNQAEVGYDATTLANNGFYAWALQHDDPNMNHDWSNPDAPFLPPSHLPAALSAAAVPEPASLTLFLPAAAMLLRRKR